MTNGDHLNGLFLSLAQKSEVPISTLAGRDKHSINTLQHSTKVLESATVWVR